MKYKPSLVLYNKWKHKSFLQHFKTFSIIAKTAGFWLPLVLVILGWRLWVNYVREDWLSSVKWVLLESVFQKSFPNSCRYGAGSFKRAFSRWWRK
ncbi:MAG: hypothetical protein R3B65_03415 [Candidatus Paceibacterota bacterium]